MAVIKTPQAQSTSFSWEFFRNWMLACTVGWGVSYFVLWTVIMIAGTVVRGIDEGFLFLASLPTIAIVVGTLQWLVMRRQISGGGRWALAALMGSVCWVLVFHYSIRAVSYPENQFYVVRLGMLLLYVAGPGAAIGALQWLFVLRRQVTHPFWWMPVSSLGWAVAHLEWIWDFDLGLAPGMATVVVRRALLGSVFGASTGICLMQLLRHTRKRIPGSEDVAT